MREDRPIDAGELRAVLGAFATGVVVVTTCNPGGQPRAITVNSFSSVSLEPPLVLYCLDKAAFHFDCFARADVFAVNILTAEQEAFSNRFAAEAEDGFDDLKAGGLASGCPVFENVLAALDCTREALHDAGDHLIIIGRVRMLQAPRAADPLVYFRGGYAGLRR